jgi:hypothetical protein
MTTRVIDFANVTGTKIFCCSDQGASCNSIHFSAPKSGRCEPQSTRCPHSVAAVAIDAGFASKASRTVYFWFALSNFSLVRSAVSNAEAHIPTQPSSSFQDARVSFSYEDQERTCGDFPPSRQGAQARLRKAGLPRVIDLNSDFCVQCRISNPR